MLQGHVRVWPFHLPMKLPVWMWSLSQASRDLVFWQKEEAQVPVCKSVSYLWLFCTLTNLQCVMHVPSSVPASYKCTYVHVQSVSALTSLTCEGNVYACVHEYTMHQECMVSCISLASPAPLMVLSSVCLCTATRWLPLWHRLWAGCPPWPTGATPPQTTWDQADMLTLRRGSPWLACLRQSPWEGQQFLWGSRKTLYYVDTSRVKI